MKMKETTSMACALALTIAPFLMKPTSAAEPGRQTVQWLYEMCTTGSREATGQVYCLAYISGIHDMMRMNSDSTDKHIRTGFGLCDDGKSTNGAAVQAFKNFAQKHPKAWSEDMLSGVVIALGDTWPCK